MHTTTAGSSFLALPGELRNRIYSHIVSDAQSRVLRKPVGSAPRPANHTWNPQLWHTGHGLTQTCRIIRAEFLPIYRAAMLDNLSPEDVYEYIDTFSRVVVGASEDQSIGCVNIDFWNTSSSILDIRPLLQTLRRAKHLHVGTHDIILPETYEFSAHVPVLDIRDILTDLYDIVDLDAFHTYVESSMTRLEIECDETKGVEIVFELGEEYWEEWMGVWSRPQDDPESRVGIPLEISEDVVRWGRGCGMELNRAEGSHLTVNFRRGPPLLGELSG